MNKRTETERSAKGRSWLGQGLRPAVNQIREPRKLRPIQQRQGVEQLEDGQVEDRGDWEKNVSVAKAIANGFD